MSEPNIHLLRALQCEAVLAQAFRVLIDNVELMINNGAIAECDASFEVLRKMSELLQSRAKYEGVVATRLTQDCAEGEREAMLKPAGELVLDATVTPAAAVQPEVADTAAINVDRDRSPNAPATAPGQAAAAKKARHAEPEVDFWARVALKQAEEVHPTRSATVLSLVPNTGSGVQQAA